MRRVLVLLLLVGLGAAAPAGSKAEPAPRTRAAAPATVTVAAVQFQSAMGDPEGNRKRLEPLIREAAGHGAKIIVLPEMAITGYMSGDLKTTWQVQGRAVAVGLTGISPASAAETVPGPSTRAFAVLADELDIYLTVPLLETDKKSGQLFNTVVLVDPDGGMLLHYRKLNPWPFAERGWADKGDHGYAYADTPYGRMALLICYDVNFEPPVLKTKKVDVLLYPIAWVDEKDSDWFEKRLPAIARENDLAIVGANWTVPEKPDWHGYGQSRIIDRQGNILARASRDIGEEILYAELAVPPTAAVPAAEGSDGHGTPAAAGGRAAPAM
jgi:predicted amidohydrolase